MDFNLEPIPLGSGCILIPLVILNIVEIFACGQLTREHQVHGLLMVSLLLYHQATGTWRSDKSCIPLGNKIACGSAFHNPRMLVNSSALQGDHALHSHHIQNLGSLYIHVGTCEHDQALREHKFLHC